MLLCCCDVMMLQSILRLVIKTKQYMGRRGVDMKVMKVYDANRIWVMERRAKRAHLLPLRCFVLCGLCLK